jgi:hypothetical protein
MDGLANFYFLKKNGNSQEIMLWAAEYEALLLLANSDSNNWNDRVVRGSGN